MSIKLDKAMIKMSGNKKFSSSLLNEKDFHDLQELEFFT